MDAREKFLEQQPCVHQEDGHVAADGEHDQSDDAHGAEQHQVRVDDRRGDAREQKHGRADEGNGREPNERREQAPLAAQRRVGKDGPHLALPEPTARHEAKDRQAEPDAQGERVDACENLVDKKGKDGGVDGDQIGKGDGEQAAGGKQRRDEGDGETGRQQDGEKQRTADPRRCHRHETYEGERRRNSAQLRHQAPRLPHGSLPPTRLGSLT